jgi:hypothetical protein
MFIVFMFPIVDEVVKLQRDAQCFDFVLSRLGLPKRDE